MSKKVPLTGNESDRKLLSDQQREDNSPTPSIVKDLPNLEEPLQQGSSKRLLIPKVHSGEERTPISSGRLFGVYPNPCR